MARKTVIQAITGALALELEKDRNVLVFGGGVGNNSGVFRATEGLQEKSGEDRVFDTPLTESDVGGLTFGLASQGYHPVPEVQFFGFVFEVFGEIVGQMARTRYRMGGTRSMPITVRTPLGGGIHTPELHLDNLEGLIAQSPGVRVVIPSNPYNAKELLISSIRSNDPVACLEHIKLYCSFCEEVPGEAYEMPLDKVAVTCEGTNVSIITYGAIVREAIKAADNLAKGSISAEIADLHTMVPLNVETIINSVEKTGRVVVAQETQKQAGIGAMVVSEVSGHAVLSLEASTGRVSAPNTIFPFGRTEGAWLPNTKDIKAKVREIVGFQQLLEVGKQGIKQVEYGYRHKIFSYYNRFPAFYS